VKEIFDEITTGLSDMEDLAILAKSSSYIRDAGLCGLGQTAPNPVLSTLRYFKDEYVEHIQKKTCQAGKCFRKEEKEQK